VPDVDLEDAIEATINIVQVAPALSILAALEGKKSCLSSRIHTYLKTQPGYLKQLSDKRAVATLAAAANSLSFCLTSNVVSASAQNVRTIGYLFVSEDTIDEIDGKIKKHKNV